MVLPEEVDETLEDEVAEECSNFGRVDTVFVYHDQSNSAVKIFVKYAIVQGKLTSCGSIRVCKEAILDL